jgi:predicted transcriptional regulator
MENRNVKCHSKQFTQVAVTYFLSNKDNPVKAIAQLLGVSYSATDNWERKVNGTARRELSSDQQRIRQLEREVAHHK